MALSDTLVPHAPPLRLAEGGRVIRVGNTRVSLDTVVYAFENGATAEEIAQLTLCAQDVGLAGEQDPAILEWAFREARVVVTHDANTMTAAAYERVSAGQSLFGVLVVSRSLGIGAAIEAILIAATCSGEEEWKDQVQHAPS